LHTTHPYLACLPAYLPAPVPACVLPAPYILTANNINSCILTVRLVRFIAVAVWLRLDIAFGVLVWMPAASVPPLTPAPPYTAAKT